MGEHGGAVLDTENEYNEDEMEEEQQGKRLLSILFGNVDDAGDLDEEYLDQDAKEHLSALARQLGPSLVDIELSTGRKRPATLPDEEEQEDYGQKAEDAVDYEDIEEQYEGPEVQIQSQDEQTISQHQQFYAQAALAGPSLKLGGFIPEEENYDEEEEDNKLGVEVPKAFSACTPEGPIASLNANEEFVQGHAFFTEESEMEETEPFEAKGKSFVSEEMPDYSPRLEMPVLCEEDGKEVLRFSELFSQQEPHWMIGTERLLQKHFLVKGKLAEGHCEAVEEDEEMLLKSCFLGHLKADDQLGMSDGLFEESGDRLSEDHGSKNLEEARFDAHDKNYKVQVRSERNSCLSSQPMKDGDNWRSVLDAAKNIPSPIFQPVYQDDWEANIHWDSEHLQHPCEDAVVDANDSIDANDSLSGIVEETGMDTSDAEMDIREDKSLVVGNECVSWQTQLENCLGKDAEQQGSYHFFRPFTIEPLVSFSQLSCNQKKTVSRHPRVLRLAMLSISKEQDKQLGYDKDNYKHDKAAEIFQGFKKLSLQNTELASGSWVEQIIWDSEQLADKGSQSLNVIYDLQDDQMVFEIPDTKEGRYLSAHAAAMVLTQRSKSSAAEVSEFQIYSSSTLARFNISNDKYYLNKKGPQQQKANAKKRALHGIKVMHSLPAVKLQTMKPKLTNKDLANFHRPKAIWYPHHNEVAAKEQGKLFVKGPMKIILKTLGGKGSKLYVDASETLEAVKLKVAKKLGDLKPSEKTKIFYSGKELEDSRTLAEQAVPPNSVIHLVRMKVHPWPRAQRLPGENKAFRPPGAFKKKSELSVKDGHVALMEYCEEHPLLLGNVGMGARLSTYYRKVSPSDSTAATLRSERGPWIGSTVTLEPIEDSPFLGDIRPGTTQSCLETNMYRAPIFQQKVATTDFLLVRSTKGKLSLRRIDSIHVVGQQEPHLEVLTPSSKNVQNYIGNRLLVYMYREFRNNEKPGCLPRVRADELTAQFPSLTEGYLRKRLKHCADLQKGPGGEMWLMRRSFRIPSEEELRRMVTPENVCTYESMQAGLHHLKRMGVNKLFQPSGLSAAMNLLPDEAIDLAAASHIERELQITPWNLSCNFVAATMQGRGSLERLEITGAGDPSGRGLGFSYLRAAPKAPGTGALVEKKAAAARGGGAVTGTDADLRRLSMDAAREVLLKFQVPEAFIEKMTRWHRIALVRKLSSEQAASGLKVGVAALNKFARGQRMSFLQLQQQTREKCQEIWDRQVQSLSAIEGELSESECEGNEDLDSFAGDLENLLEAEEAQDEEVASKKGRKEIIRGIGVRRRALDTQREEDMEDEEAEAAELRRMLREDDETKEEKKKKKVNDDKTDNDMDFSTKEEVATGPKANSNRKIMKVLKRIIHTKKPDGTSSRTEILITDPKEVAQYLARKNAPQNGGNIKELKKTSLPGKKEKKPASEKDGKKALPANKKLSKGKPGKDGLRLSCGACGQVGHMRTNKKCPLYKDDGENVQKQDASVAEKPVEKQGVKVTLKKDVGAQPKKKQAGSQKDSKNEKPEKLPFLKIKLPIIGHSEPVFGGVNKLNEDVSPLLGPENSGHVNEFATSNRSFEGGTNGLNKIKVKKKRNIVRDDGSLKEKQMPRGTQTERKSGEDRPGLMTEHEDRTMEQTEKKRQLQLDNERNTALQGQREEDERREREEKLKKQREEDAMKKKERQRLRLEKQQRKAKREERRRREKEQQITMQLEIDRELERQELEREAELERIRQLEIEREREAERAREEERKKELHREQQHREKEWRKAAERPKARKVVEKERRFMDNERGKGAKRRASSEHEGYQSFDFCPQPKRRKGGEVMLANILEIIVDTLRKKTEISYLFLKPVTKKEAPDYLDVIRYPMDLSTIREKVRKMEYRSRQEFQRDVWQITENAHIYNDHRNPGIPPLADRLLQFCEDILEQKDLELTEAEKAVERLDQDPGYAARTATPITERRRASRYH